MLSISIAMALVDGKIFIMCLAMFYKCLAMNRLIAPFFRVIKWNKLLIISLIHICCFLPNAKAIAIKRKIRDLKNTHPQNWLTKPKKIT